MWMERREDAGERTRATFWDICWGGGVWGGLETNFIYTLASTRHQKHEEHASAPPQRSCTNTSQSDVVGLNHFRLLTLCFGSAHARGLFIY